MMIKTMSRNLYESLKQAGHLRHLGRVKERKRGMYSERLIFKEQIIIVRDNENAYTPHEEEIKPQIHPIDNY